MLNIAICYALKLDQMMLALTEDLFGRKSFLSFDMKFVQKYADFFEVDDDSSVENSDSSDSNLMDSRRYDNSHSTDKHSEIEMEFSLFDKSIQDLETRLKNVSKFLPISDADFLDSKHDLSYFVMHVLKSLYVLQQNDYEEALEFWEAYLDISQRWFQSMKCQILKKNIKRVMFVLFGLIPAFAANCLVELNRFDEALVHLHQLDEHTFFRQLEVNKFYNNIENTIENSETDIDHRYVILIHLIAGGIWFKMKNFEKSLYHLQISFGLVLSLEAHDNFGSSLGHFGIELSSRVVYFNGIGSCLMEMKQYENALVYFNQAVKFAVDDDFHNKDDYDKNDVKFKIYMLPEVFQWSASFLNLNSCLLKLRKFDEAFICLKKALEVSADWKLEKWQTETFTTALKKKRVETLAKIYFEIGLWYKKHNYLKQAVIYFQNSLSIFRKLSTAKGISLLSAELLHSHMQIYLRTGSENFLRESNKFASNLAINPDSNFVEDDAL